MIAEVLHFSLLCHFLGDYVLQSHIMATKKTSSSWWALVHALFYGIPFGVLILFYQPDFARGLAAWLIIIGTHGFIDRFRIASYWCNWWGVGNPGKVWPSDGMEAPPPFLAVWLLIIVDNILHMSINAATLFWLLD